MKSKSLIVYITLYFFYFNAWAETKKILFIGNSYTYVNDLPLMLSNVSNSVNDTIIYDSNTIGGYTLQQHASNATTLNKIMLGIWDVVSLQEQSQFPSFPIGQVQTEVFPFASFLDSLVKISNPCGNSMFYMTWGRKNGDASNCPNWPPVCTYNGMDSLLNLRYRMMANDNQAELSPVGAVWKFIRTNYPSIELYSSDESHPSVAGTYAAALCFYTSIFRKNPELISFNSTLTSSDANNIKTAVNNIVFNNLAEWNIGSFDPNSDFSFSQNLQAINFSNNSAFSNAYEWDFGDGSNTSFEENPNHNYSAVGNYTVRLISKKCTKADTSFQTINIVSVGLKELNNSVSFYPNPGNGHIYFDHTISHQTFSVYDFMGKKISEVKMNTATNSIDISEFSDGIYYFTESDLSKNKSFIYHKISNKNN